MTSLITTTPNISANRMEDIRRYAKQGHSFSFTAELLGLSRKSLHKLLETEVAKSIQFVKGTQSLASRRRLEDLHASNVGRPMSAKGRAALAKALTKHWTLHTAFGVTGLLRELKEHFGSQVSLSTLRNRLDRGMSIEEALTLPPQVSWKRGVLPPQFQARVTSNRRRARARIDVVIARKLTPTMLQYSSPPHDLVVTSVDASWIVVEVRSTCGRVLHKLRFIKSFGDSGVLFAFKPDVQWRLDFIAFEPNSDALTARLETTT